MEEGGADMRRLWGEFTDRRGGVKDKDLRRWDIFKDVTSSSAGRHPHALIPLTPEDPVGVFIHKPFPSLCPITFN